MLRTVVARTVSITARQVRSASAIRCVRAFSDLVSGGEVAAPPANIKTVRHELARVLDEDAAELGAAPDSGLIEFIKEQGMKIVTDKEGQIKVTRLVGDYEITTVFSCDADESMDEEETEQEQEETTPENDEEEDFKLPSHGFDVDIKNVKATTNSTLRVACRSSKEGELVIDAIIVDPQPIQAEEFVSDATRLDVADLSENGQEKILELLESLSIDDRLAQFVQHYSQVVRTQQYLDKLRKFKAFLQN